LAYLGDTIDLKNKIRKLRVWYTGSKGSRSQAREIKWSEEVGARKHEVGTMRHGKWKSGNRKWEPGKGSGNQEVETRELGDRK
jgi:hypothetical protein